MFTQTTTERTVRHERDFLRYRESISIDEQTWAAEQLDAQVAKPLEYRYRDGELWSEEGRSLGEIFRNSVAFYHNLVKEFPELTFQLRRARAEYREYEAMKAMARSEAPNTLVVVSPLPRELEEATDDVLGYQPDRGLGFLRVITVEGGGRMKLRLHSFDRSDPHAIEAMYGFLGRSVDWGSDVVEQPVALSIDAAEERELLGDRLLLAYDRELTQRYGGHWQAGREIEKDQREANGFIAEQRDLVEAHVDALMHVGPKSALADTLRYDFVAALRRRFRGDTRHQDGAQGSAAIEMATAGHEAALSGEKASGCGLTITAKATTAEELEEAGYQLRPGEKKLDECMSCPVCQAQGVWVEKNAKGKKDYTCDNDQCGATTATQPVAKPAAKKATADPASRRKTSPREWGAAPDLLSKLFIDSAPADPVEIVIGGVRKIVA